MRIDLEHARAVAEVQQRELPWDLELKIGESWHRVRPLTIADASRMSRAGLITDEKEARAMVIDLFEEPKPQSPSVPQMEAALIAINAAFEEHLKKKSLILVSSIKRELAAAEKPGT